MISIIIRAKNEMPWIKHTLRMLKLQNRQDFEVIAVDSGSTDGSYESLLDFKPEVLYRIEPEDYIPGKVLNEAIRHTRGDIIVFNNADCIPQDRSWLDNLVQPLETGNMALAAVFANQIARPNAHPLVRKDYERAFGDGSIHNTWRHFFSLASSAVRRDLILQYPFLENIQYSEDIEWSWRMRTNGYDIQYVRSARVEHSHNYNLAGLSKRFYGEGKAESVIYQDFYLQNPDQQKRDFSLLRSVMLPVFAETLRDTFYLIEQKEFLWLPIAPLNRFLQRYYAYRGRTGR